MQKRAYEYTAGLVGSEVCRRDSVYLTLYRHDGKEGRRLSPLEGPAMVGEYRDHFLRTPEGWRISRREIEVSFLREEEGMSWSEIKR